MKTIVVKTEKVVSHQANGMPVIEEIEQKISPELTFNKFVELLPNQNYKSAQVVRVLESQEIDKKMVSKEVDEVEKYQKKIDDVLMKGKGNTNDSPDYYKALSEKQSKLLAQMEARLEALEGKGNKLDRDALEAKAKELNVQFRANIGDEKLLEKIKEVDENFEL